MSKWLQKQVEIERGRLQDHWNDVDKESCMILNNCGFVQPMQGGLQRELEQPPTELENIFDGQLKMVSNNVNLFQELT